VSLIPGNVEYLAFGVQADKDTPATVPVIAIALEDCQLDPNPTDIVTAESDASAQQGDTVRVGAEPGGTFKKYVRPSEEDFFLNALLGKTVDAGTTPKTHTGTLDPTDPFGSPYLTVWDVWPGVATVRYDGARIAQGVFNSQPGQTADAEYTLQALKATLGVDEPDPTGLFIDELPFSWANFVATLGGVHAGVVNSFALTITRNTGRFHGDNGLDSLDIPNGLFAATGSLTVAFEDDTLLRAANTGTTSGTVLTDTVYSEALILDLLRGVDLEVQFSMAGVQIKNFKTALNTDGSPAVSTFDFNSKRQATLSDAMTTLVKNAIAHADRSA
jgi:hypothetical protein